VATGEKPTQLSQGTFRFTSPQEIEDRRTAVALHELQVAIQQLNEAQGSLTAQVDSIETDTIAGILELLADDPELSSDAFDRIRERIKYVWGETRRNRKYIQTSWKWRHDHILSARAFFTDDAYSLISTDSKVTVTASNAWLKDGTTAAIAEADFDLPASTAGPLWLYQHIVVSGGAFTTNAYASLTGATPPVPDDGAGTYKRLIAKLVEDGTSDRWSIEQHRAGDWLEPGGAGDYTGPFAVTDDPSPSYPARVNIGDNMRTTLSIPGVIHVHPDKITKSTKENVTISGNGYIYYAITRDGTVAASAAYAASVPAHTATTLYWPLAYVTYSGGSVGTITQLHYGQIITDKTILTSC